MRRDGGMKEDCGGMYLCGGEIGRFERGMLTILLVVLLFDLADELSVIVM